MSVQVKFSDDMAKKGKPTAVELDDAYLRLLCAAVTGLALDKDWEPQVLADQAEIIADAVIGKWEEAYEYHRH